jgi:hypothetical protein
MRNWRGISVIDRFLFGSRILSVCYNIRNVYQRNTRSEVLSEIGVLTAQVLLEIVVNILRSIAIDRRKKKKKKKNS